MSNLNDFSQCLFSLNAYNTYIDAAIYFPQTVVLLGDIHIHKCPFLIFTQQNVNLLSPLLNCTCNRAVCFHAQYILVGWKVDTKYKHLFQNAKYTFSKFFEHIAL